MSNNEKTEIVQEIGDNQTKGSPNTKSRLPVSRVKASMKTDRYCTQVPQDSAFIMTKATVS